MPLGTNKTTIDTPDQSMNDIVDNMQTRLLNSNMPRFGISMLMGVVRYLLFGEHPNAMDVDIANIADVLVKPSVIFTEDDRKSDDGDAMVMEHMHIIDSTKSMR